MSSISRHPAQHERGHATAPAAFAIPRPRTSPEASTEVAIPAVVSSYWTRGILVHLVDDDPQGPFVGRLVDTDDELAVYLARSLPDQYRDALVVEFIAKVARDADAKAPTPPARVVPVQSDDPMSCPECWCSLRAFVAGECIHSCCGLGNEAMWDAYLTSLVVARGRNLNIVVTR